MEHFYRGIQGWFSFADLYKEQVRKAKSGAVFVEVGAWKGRSAAFMAVEIANSRKRIEFHVVDHFRGSAEQIARGEPEVVNGTLLEVFERNVNPARKYITLHVGESVQVANEFADGSIDFLLIDGSHDYESVLADFRAWAPKVRGLIAGDDYRKPGVRQAVDEHFGTVVPISDGKCWRAR